MTGRGGIAAVVFSDFIQWPGMARGLMRFVPPALSCRLRQRSLFHFSIGDDRMPKGVYHAYG
jgi:hypothetical protein